MQQHERHEVVGLQHLVAELGEGDPRAHPRLDGLTGEHGADREVLADVAQEADDVELRQPRVVVGEDGGVRPAVEIEEGTHLPLEPLRPLGDLLFRVQRALAGLAARITDEAGAAAHEDDGPVAGQLHAAQGQQRQETADVQAVGGGIEAHVGRTAPGGQVRVELVGGGDIRDQLAALEIAQQLRAHGRNDYRTGIMIAHDL